MFFNDKPQIKASFTPLVSNDKYFIIADDKNGMSVTNDIKNVLRYCEAECGFNPATQQFIYLDTSSQPTLATLNEDGSAKYAYPSPTILQDLKALDIEFEA